MNSNHKILVAPLDWGLGHATRCVPIILQLLERNVEVMIASSGRSEKLLRTHFPDLQFLTLPGYGVSHPAKGSFAIHLARKSGSVFKRIKEENEELKRIVNEYQISAVISDNRYGLHHPEIPCVLITHQIFIQAPWPLKNWLKRIVHGFVLKFDSCWVPDFEGEPNLSGKLSHGEKLPFNVRYIGPLSRFSGEVKSKNSNIDILALISGPEPHRSYFEQLVFRQLLAIRGNHLLVCGRPNEEAPVRSEVVKTISHLDDDELKETINSSRHIICRSGYSTLMDLYALGVGATLIPTPGQTEQEYLAKHWSEYCPVQSQNSMNLAQLMESQPFPKQAGPDLKEIISDWLENIS